MARQGRRGLAHPDDRNHKCGQEIRDADMRQPEKVRAHAENQDIADGTQRRQSLRRHDRLQKARQKKNRALKNADRQGRKDTPLAERRRHNHDDDRIEHRLGKQLPL